MRTRGTPMAVVAISLMLGVVAAPGISRGTPVTADANEVPLADASIIIEVNATDGDAGLQVFLDGEDWSEMTVTSPDGRQMSAVKNSGRLTNWGLTELFWESAEPPFDEVPFWRFKKRFPEGVYRFEGMTVDGKRLVGAARLTHDVPQGPVITSPTDGEIVPLGDVLVTWEPVTKPLGITIVGYRVIVSDETSPQGFGLEVELGPEQTSINLPSEYFQAGTEYKLEVQAIEKGGNQTLTEITFSVA